MKDKKQETLIISGSLPDYSEFSSQLKVLEMDNEVELERTIHVEVMSPGGCIVTGFAMAGRLENSPCTITTEGYGEVASAAVLPFLAGKIRKLSRHCFITLHEPSLNFSDVLKIQDAESAVMESRSFETQYIDYLVSHSNKTFEFYKKLVKDGKDHKLNAETALEYGLIHEII